MEVFHMAQLRSVTWFCVYGDSVEIPTGFYVGMG